MAVQTQTKNRKNLKNFVTPKGLAYFPKLNDPDEFKGTKSYKTGLIVDPSDERVAKFLAFLDIEAQRVYKACMEDAEAKGGKTKASSKSWHPHVPYEDHFDKDGNETGMVLIKAKCGADYPPKLMDTQKNVIEDEVWSNSVIQVAGKLSEFGPLANRCGVSLRMYQVMVHELNSGSGGSGDFEFDAPSDDGFVSDNVSFDVPSEAPASGSVESDGDF